MRRGPSSPPGSPSTGDGGKQPLAPPSRPEGLLFKFKLNLWLWRAPGVELAFGSFRGGEKAPMLLVRIVMMMMVLLASPANCSETKVVRSDTAYGCTSYQAYEFFGRFLAGGNARVIQFTAWRQAANRRLEVSRDTETSDDNTDFVRGAVRDARSSHPKGAAVSAGGFDHDFAGSDAVWSQ